ncbi:DUF58 domain-containing protein [Saccharomonospora cyanea]|uniref:DUF58 domain-containing protein n=1 Tax=Saccharomonospora cyanea NA-134 TaxID=882082 RepID=H5XLX3_9PSEU|nr:DUF58 domain-containing protein [Saccharomonospora cyanea]EHR62015.1 hypothetical protein SaccyDRAFT_3179 [Saccharomonospora cyanea NA-134]
MRLTARGAVVLAVSVAMLLFGQWAGYPLPRGLGAAGSLSVVAALALSARGPKVEARRVVFPERVERGSPALARLSLTNASTRWQQGLRLTDGVAHARQELRTSALRPGQSTVRRYELPTTRRGRYAVGPLTLYRVGPFGLASRRWTAGETATLWVHPRRLAARPLPGRLLRHARHTGTPGALRGVEDLRDVREYVPGDEVRHLYWKATARTGRLMVRDLVDPGQPRVTVAVDTRSDVLSPELFEDAVDVAASVLTACGRAGQPTRLVTSAGRELVAGPGEETTRMLLDELCVVCQEGERADPVVPEVSAARSASDVLVVVTSVRADPDSWRVPARRSPAAICLLLGDEPGVSVDSGVTVLRAPTANEAVGWWNKFVA